MRESDYPHLDLSFYRSARKFLETQNFTHLQDWEDRTVNAAPGNVLMPVMIRVMVSPDDTIMAGIYHARIRPRWLRALLFLLGKRPGKIVDFE